MGVQPPEARGFFNFKALKCLKIGTKHLKNAKINNANLYYDFPPRFLKTFFQQGGPPAPPVESPMLLSTISLKLTSHNKRKTCNIIMLTFTCHAKPHKRHSYKICIK